MQSAFSAAKTAMTDPKSKEAQSTVRGRAESVCKLTSRIYYIGACVGRSAHGAGASAPWGVDAGWITRCWRPRQPRRGSLVRLGRPLWVALSRSRQKVFACLRSAQRLQAASLPDPDTHSLAAPRVLPIEAVSQRGAVGLKLPASPPQLRGWTRFRPELDVLGSCGRGSRVLRMQIVFFESA